jgi:hypothetical protein
MPWVRLRAAMELPRRQPHEATTPLVACFWASLAAIRVVPPQMHCITHNDRRPLLPW